MIVAAMAMVAAGFTACGNGAPKASLKSDVDSMSYAIGMAQTQGLKEYLVDRLGVDTAYIGEFIKGLNEGANAGDNKKKAAYYAGIQIGQQIANQMVKGINQQVFGEDSTKTISMKNFMAGFISGTTGKGGLMTIDEAGIVAQSKMQEIRAREMEKAYGPNKEEGEKFLAANAKKDGVKTLESGVQYKVLKEGTGAIPADTSLVKVHYEGRLLTTQCSTVLTSVVSLSPCAATRLSRVGLMQWFTCPLVQFGRFTFPRSWLMASVSRASSSLSLCWCSRLSS